jgi:hypothetical protein
MRLRWRMAASVRRVHWTLMGASSPASAAATSCTATSPLCPMVRTLQGALSALYLPLTFTAQAVPVYYRIDG